jgi:uroporphyrinogen decarboxylase
MNLRENTLAVLNYEPYDRLPVVHFGFWRETLEKWAAEGHIPPEYAKEWKDWDGENAVDQDMARRLGFDFNWHPANTNATGLRPGFGWNLLETTADGFRKIRNNDGVILLERDGAGSIPAETGHTLTDRASWEKEFIHRLQFTPDRVDLEKLSSLPGPSRRIRPAALHAGSLFGVIRNWMGLEGVSYLYADDEDLFAEIVNTVGELCFRCVEHTFRNGLADRFDYLHFWEDICFNSGPLVVPSVFEKYVAPHYRRITDLAAAHGIGIVSLDCDGLIDALLPIWLRSGVNIMFPIEVGTWDASIEPWRRQYGRELRGVGGMRKYVFALERRDVDAEVERLRRLVDLGGYIPCPDHRIPPDAKWDNVLHYCERMHQVFG